MRPQSIAVVGWSAQLKVLGMRDLRYVFGATLVSNLGDGIVAIALTWAVLDLTHSATKLGIVLAAKLTAKVVVILFAGVIGDRASRRRVMVSADLVRLFGQAGIGVLLVTGRANLTELVLSQLLLGAASAFFQPASSGLLPAVAGEHKQEANAMQGIAGAATSIIGPAIGAVLVVAIGGAWGLLADSISYGLSALCLSQLGPGVGDAPAPKGARASMLADLRSGFREFISRAWVWTMVITFAVANALNTTWDVFGPLATRRWYGGAPAFALLSVLWSVGTLLGGVLLLRVKPRRPLLVGVLVCAPCALPAVLLAYQVPLEFVGALQIVSGMGVIAFNTLWWTALQQHVPPESISRVTSYDYAGSYLLMPLGTAMAGPLAVGIGLRGAMVSTGIVSLALMAATLLLPAVRQLRTEPEPGDIVSA
jgi:MFS family permease